MSERHWGIDRYLSRFLPFHFYDSLRCASPVCAFISINHLQAKWNFLFSSFWKLSSLLPIDVAVVVFGKAIFSLYGLQINKYDLLLLRWACYTPLDICQHNDGREAFGYGDVSSFLFSSGTAFFYFYYYFCFCNQLSHCIRSHNWIEVGKIG